MTKAKKSKKTAETSEETTTKEIKQTAKEAKKELKSISTQAVYKELEEKCSCGGTITEKICTYGQFLYTLTCDKCHTRVATYDEKYTFDLYKKAQPLSTELKSDLEHIDINIWTSWVPPVLKKTEEEFVPYDDAKEGKTCETAD